MRRPFQRGDSSPLGRDKLCGGLAESGKGWAEAVEERRSVLDERGLLGEVMCGGLECWGPAHDRRPQGDTVELAQPRCQAGHRYHVPPWMVVLPLDKNGDNLLPGVGQGQVEGRAAFFDLSMDGRWGGVISGDKIRFTYEPCACGNRSPSVHEDIQRYADMASGDKIACAGTIDAYVRGVA